MSNAFTFAENLAEKMSKLTHTDEKGKASMVDVGHKAPLHRAASAEGMIHLQNETIALIRDNEIKKGDVLTVAEIAGIQAAKRTAELVPLCHPLLLNAVKVTATLTDQGVAVKASVSCNGNTGVEMEALTAVQIALLTVYDMCKAVDKNMVMSDIRLLSKTKTSEVP
ncbi:MAG TPA: cyclic pyranopterin monophosphate synthase MoaC [Bacteroidales bacterium]|nr:cyclic pyranopterin monophosphate synthase MoaC [Bacteroidales bacterium]HQQ12164.1 cyclic pyranopterin monophosphate synthase MoaC [Bacteroidales bacterium]